MLAPYMGLKVPQSAVRGVFAVITLDRLQLVNTIGLAKPWVLISKIFWMLALHMRKKLL